MGSQVAVRGAIIDSWVEPPGSSVREGARLVLQVAPRGRPRDLMIVEAAASLLPDDNWLADLSENLCHGSPVAIVGRLTTPNMLSATQLVLQR